jgi:hypothetical protein
MRLTGNCTSVPAARSPATSHDGIFPHPRPARSSASLMYMSVTRQVEGESTSMS